MQQNLIHKVHITPEAVFDYEECMELDVAPKKDIKNQIEDYIYKKQHEGQKILWYFRIEIYDKQLNKNADGICKKGANVCQYANVVGCRYMSRRRLR